MEKVYRAEDVAQWFVNRAAMDVEMFYGDYVTNMKLQKLLYFAQGLSFAIYGRPLFKDKIQAWEYGPVVPNVYHKYKVCKAAQLIDTNPVTFDEETSALLEYVFRKYAIYSASELVKISHKQKSYNENYVEGKRDVEISNNDIKKDFVEGSERLKKEFKKQEKDCLEFAETCYINSDPELKSKIEAEKEDLVEVNWKDEL